MSNQNLYHILDIPDYSDISIVKKAFRQMALKYHPDRNPDPSVVELFKNIVKSYEILNNPYLKQQYDIRLQNGFSFTSVPVTPQESDFETKRRSYAKMRKERDEMEEVENITAYENSLKTIPFIWRIVIIGLLLFTGIISIMSDWYIRGNKIALGFILFSAAAIFLWNELYKYFWHKSLTKDEQKYYKQATTWFIAVFFLGIFSTFSLIKIKKEWHLHYFGKVLYADIDAFKNTISFTYADHLYSFDLFDSDNFNHKALIRISTKEPEIWEYVGE